MVLTERHAPRVSVALVVAGVLLLAAGGWVRFDDTSGYAEGTWLVLPPALLCGVAALVFGLATRASRKALGIALLVLAGLLFVAKRGDGFRFIWAGDEGELFLFQLLLVALALALLLAPEGGREPAGLVRVRWWAYPALLIALPVVAFNVGIGLFQERHCSAPDFDGECDLSVLWGIAGAVGLFLAGAVVLLVLEARARRRSGQLSGSR